MTDEHWTWQYRKEIPSRAGSGRGVEEEIIGRLERENWPPRDVFAIRLALEEALVNAIKHGNHFDADKRVRVECILTGARVRICIADEGEGFDPADVPDPTDAENLDRPSGRGIMLMRNFMTHVGFSPRGNEVILEKDRSRPEPSRVG